MKDSLVIKKVLKNKNRIDIIYEANGKWKELLNLSEKFWIEYNINIESVPDSLAVVPFLCNVLPISWVFNLKINIDILDKSFFDSIENIKKGYSNMYPTIKMLGNIEVSNLEENQYIHNNNNGVLFSGGVDAFNTLIKHIDEKPTLLTVWGADINLDDLQGWDIVNNLNIETAEQFSLDYLNIKTNFRTFINYKALSTYVAKFINGEWWHEFQHGIGLIGLSAPLAYIKKFAIVYIASSFTKEDKGKYTCASDPTIDNYLKFSSCNIVHDGYEFNRQDKIHNICNYVDDKNLNIKLRVCWESSGGKNCCRCEKCCRTMLGIITEKKIPNNFGFDFNDVIRKKMMKTLPKYVKYNLSQQYSGMQKRFIDNYSITETPADLMWFRNIKIDNVKPKYVIFYEKIINLVNKVVRKLKKIFKF